MIIDDFDLLEYRAGGDHYVECYYHTRRWIELVEQGYTTMWVDRGISLMLRQNDTVLRRGA